ncbi:MAG: GTPase Era [Oscillospiraceae bacterium]|jgi:GTP-binding protein Era|nr:GTPase Era [Oscillospiraceae bacterium]
MTKTVFAAVCGKANAGKSSLVNLLVGEKVAITGEKPQTTRARINGVLTRGEIQYVFTDTPGLHKPENTLSRHMLKSIRSGAAGADAILFVADCSKKSGGADASVLEFLENVRGSDVILLLNKIDLVKDKSALLGIIDEYRKIYGFAQIIPISVKDGTNTEKILPLLSSYAKKSEFFFEPGLSTDQSERVWLSEIIREKLLNALREEVPHGIAVGVESVADGKTKKGEEIVDVSAVIVCEKQSHKGMVIGKGGALLKKIGESARMETEEYFGRKVNLKLWVKVAEDWRNRENLINKFGLKSE